MSSMAPYGDPNIRALRHFEGARRHGFPQDRLRALIRGAHSFREEFISDPTVDFFGTFDLAQVPYPTRYGLRDACSLPFPYLHILNRLFVVQFQSADGPKTLLAGPLDPRGQR